jgi:hypothetical protein
MIEMVLQEGGCEDMDWIGVAEDTEWWVSK